MKYNPIIHPLKFIIHLIDRFNFVLFIVIVAGGLIFSILILNNILTQPYGSDTNATTFDRSTINRLMKLETSSNNTSHNNLPTGRINPFSE